MNDKKKVKIEKTEGSLRIWHYGTLQYNYHSTAYKIFKERNPFGMPLLQAVLYQDDQLRNDLIDQLEEEGYFKHE